MKQTVNWKDLQLRRQCGTCKYYVPKIIDNVLTARGNCRLSGIYKMRTETCMKFKILNLKEND